MATFFEASKSPLLFEMPIAAIPKSGNPTPVIQKPMMAGILLAPDNCPIYTGKIKLPAPKNIPNNIDPSNR